MFNVYPANNIICSNNTNTNVNKTTYSKIDNFYKSSNKQFILRTKIIENENTVCIKRTYIWFNHKTSKFHKKIEVQTYDCEDTCDTVYENHPEFDILKEL